MDEVRRRLLQGMPIFGGLSDAALDLLVERAGVHTVSAGEYFFHEGAREVSAFVLERGSVSVLKAWRGRQYVLRTLGEGDCFGEMTLIDFAPRSASVRADEDCIALQIDTAALRALHDLDLEQYTLVLLNMAREVSRRLREADIRLFEARGAELPEEPPTPEKLVPDYSFRGL